MMQKRQSLLVAFLISMAMILLLSLLVTFNSEQLLSLVKVSSKNSSIISTIADFLTLIIGLPIAVAGTYFAILIAMQAKSISESEAKRQTVEMTKRDIDFLSEHFSSLTDLVN